MVCLGLEILQPKLKVISCISPVANGKKQNKAPMIDPDGFRPNVAMVIMNDDGQVFWAQRTNNDGWQFPQGGINSDEIPREAMYRELYEETGLHAEQVDLLGSTPGWLRYQLPRRFQRSHSRPVCIGQKQVWFLLKLRDENVQFNFELTGEPEFKDFRWVNFWYPADNVIRFKRRVYRQALTLLEPLASPKGAG